MSIANMKPMPHQIEDKDFISQRESKGLGWLLARPPGVGKTLAIILYLMSILPLEAAKGLGKTLFVVPACIRTQWKTILSANGLAKFTSVVSYEMIAIRFKYGKIHSVMKQKWRRVVLDEAQKIRKFTTACHKACFMLHAQLRGAVTGTPITDKVGDLFVLRQWVNTRMDKPEPMPPLTYDKTNKDFTSWILAGTRDDFKDILPKVHMHHHHINRHADDIQAEHDSIVVNDCAHMKRRLASLTPLLTHGDRRTPKGPTKVSKTVSIVNATSPADSTIIFTTYRKEQEVLADALANRENVVRVINADVPDHERAAIHEEVRNNSNYSEVAMVLLLATSMHQYLINYILGYFKMRHVTIMQTHCGGVGLNLQMYNHAIFGIVSWSPADDSQAYGRVARMGQKKPVHVHWIYADAKDRDTVDNRVVTLRTKKVKTIAKYTSLINK